MAAKSTAKPVAKKATAQRGRPKGLQLSAAQQKAYSKAFAAAATATRNRLALQSAANQLRHYRLSSAYGIRKKYNVTRQMVRTAAIAAQASRMSFIQSQRAHQNVALLHRIEQNMLHHVQVQSRLQYIRGGERAFTRTAIARTLTSAQALTYERRVFALMARSARNAKASVKKGKQTPLAKAQAAAVQKAGVAAGLAAARAVPKNARAPKTTPGRPSQKASAPKPARASAPSAAKTPATGKKTPVAAKAAKASKGRAAKPPWNGDEDIPNCVITAIANHLLLARSIAVGKADLEELTDACHEEPTIEEALWQAWLMAWPSGKSVRLKAYFSTDPALGAPPGSIVGYDTEYGPHAALAVGLRRVVSWGNVMPLEAPVEEVWTLSWET